MLKRELLSLYFFLNFPLTHEENYELQYNNLLLAYKTKLISCSSDENIKIWSLVTCECIQVIKVHLEMVNNLELTKDSKLLSSSIDKTVKLWQIETGEELKSIEFDFSK